MHMLKIIVKALRAPIRLVILLLDHIFPKNPAPRARKDGPSAEGFNNLGEKEFDGADEKQYAGIRYFARYRDPAVKNMIWQFKYYLNSRAMTWCAYILYDELIAEASDRVTRAPFREPCPLIHCPSSTYFKGDKKFDHMKELLRAFEDLQDPAAPFFIPCVHAVLPNIGVKAVDAKAQHTGTRKERLEWAKQRFVISEKFEKYLMETAGPAYAKDSRIIQEMPGATDRSRTIYCIDDVVTTGASLNAISKMLERKFNVNVKAFCLCH